MTGLVRVGRLWSVRDGTLTEYYGPRKGGPATAKVVKPWDGRPFIWRKE